MRFRLEYRFSSYKCVERRSTRREIKQSGIRSFISIRTNQKATQKQRKERDKQIKSSMRKTEE